LEPRALTADWRDGREKLFLATRLLGLRRERPTLFAEGSYVPLYGEGGRSDDHLCAFARQRDDITLVVAAPRLVGRLYQEGEGANWGGTTLPLPIAGPWHDILGRRCYGESGRVPASELFAEFPVAALLHTGD
jgi:(1->4)-alpha-D-glucan 1-alpha-D-glucosylmutase